MVVVGGYLRDWADYSRVVGTLLPSAWPRLIVLVVGVVDDTRGMGPRVKLLGQAAAVLVLFLGGIRIDGRPARLTIPLDSPSVTFRSGRRHRSRCPVCW